MKSKTSVKVPQRKPVSKMSNTELENKILTLVQKQESKHKLDDDYSLPKK